MPLALFSMRMCKRAKNSLSPIEVIFGRPHAVGLNPHAKSHLSTDLREHAMISYCQYLSKTLSQVHQQVKDALPKAAEGPLHPIRPGDWVLIKKTEKFMLFVFYFLLRGVVRLCSRDER